MAGFGCGAAETYISNVMSHVMARKSDSSYCAEQVRTHDGDRYLCGLFAPEPRRRALFALYAFNIEVARIREAVSEPLLGHVRLQWWREAILGIYEGSSRDHPVVRALADAIGRFDLSRTYFDRLIEARGFDLDDSPPEDLPALKRYAEETSANLILLALEALEVREGRTFWAGRHVGVAWALTGLLRAVPSHARAKRLYLPADLMEKEGVRKADLFALKSSAGLAAVARTLAGEAREHLAQARALSRHVPRQAVPALLPAALAEAYLRRMERRGFNLFDPRLGVSKPGRQARLLVKAIRGRF